MVKIYAKLQALKTREVEGQGLVEYGLILALIAVVCIGALTTLGGDINGMLGTLAGSI